MIKGGLDSRKTGICRIINAELRRIDEEIRSLRAKRCRLALRLVESGTAPMAAPPTDSGPQSPDERDGLHRSLNNPTHCHTVSEATQSN
jgi:hypothetical protein